MRPDPAPAPVAPTCRPPMRFVVSGTLAGLLLLGIGALLIAESIKASPKMRAAALDYIPGAAAVACWIYYVQRPKTVAAIRWNWAFLVGLAFLLVLVALLIKPNPITVILLYWWLAVLTTAGAPVLVLLAVIAVHLSICVKAAASLASLPSRERAA